MTSTEKELAALIDGFRAIVARLDQEIVDLRSQLRTAEKDREIDVVEVADERIEDYVERLSDALEVRASTIESQTTHARNFDAQRAIAAELRQLAKLIRTDTLEGAERE